MAYIDKIKTNLKTFFEEFESACKKYSRGSSSVSVLLATKYLNKEQLASFIDLYYRLRGENVLIGENKVKEFLEKQKFLNDTRPDLSSKYYRVMIGNLQKNKINKALTVFDEIWGVDSRELAREIDKRVKTPKLPVFLEINVSGEATKHGIHIDDAEKAIEEVLRLEKLILRGLMTMAPETDDRGYIKSVFRKLRTLADKHNLKTSMGMSGDWEEAISEGSNVIRIGSKIFR